MSILISGMEMPKDGSWTTVRIYPDGTCAVPNWQGDCTLIKGAKAVIDKFPKWIPVTERPPKENGAYLVYVYGEVTEMNYWHGKWHMLRDDYTKAVTHWMPLPEPPREES